MLFDSPTLPIQNATACPYKRLLCPVAHVQGLYDKHRRSASSPQWDRKSSNLRSRLTLCGFMLHQAIFRYSIDAVGLSVSVVIREKTSSCPWMRSVVACIGRYRRFVSQEARWGITGLPTFFY